MAYSETGRTGIRQGMRNLSKHQTTNKRPKSTPKPYHDHVKCDAIRNSQHRFYYKATTRKWL